MYIRIKIFSLCSSSSRTVGESARKTRIERVCGCECLSFQSVAELAVSRAIAYEVDREGRLSFSLSSVNKLLSRLVHLSMLYLWSLPLLFYILIRISVQRFCRFLCEASVSENCWCMLDWSALLQFPQATWIGREFYHSISVIKLI